MGRMELLLAKVSWLGQNFFKLIYKPSYCNFLESREKKILKLFFILSTDSKHYLFR